MNFNTLDTIAQQFGTPFYLMDKEMYIKNITALRQINCWLFF